MKFDLTNPCAECPFRNDRPGFLRKAKIRRLKVELLKAQRTFACHKTVEYPEGSTKGKQNENTQHCAGAMIMIEKIKPIATPAYELAHRIAVISGQPDFCNPARLNLQAPVFNTFEEMEAAQHG